MKTGLIVSILENKRIGNCSNGGVSSKYSSLILIDPSIKAPFIPDDGEPHLILVKRWEGTDREYIHAEVVFPEGKPKDVAGPMMGGCFIYSSDSRFPGRYPIPLHDRYETWKQYKTLST